jgi:hypothetical protein
MHWINSKRVGLQQKKIKNECHTFFAIVEGKIHFSLYILFFHDIEFSTCSLEGILMDFFRNLLSSYYFTAIFKVKEKLHFKGTNHKMQLDKYKKVCLSRAWQSSTQL